MREFKFWGDRENLFHKRWHIRVLAQLADLNGARFVVMKNQLGVTADSLTRCLQELIEAGWVQRNPGYGHPLRPEYILTPQGHTIAPLCQHFVSQVAATGAAEVVYRKWSVPVMLGLYAGRNHFSALRSHIGLTPRALSQGLDRLCDANLADHDGTYLLTPDGSRIARAALPLSA